VYQGLVRIQNEASSLSLFPELFLRALSATGLQYSFTWQWKGGVDDANAIGIVALFAPHMIVLRCGK